MLRIEWTAKAINEKVLRRMGRDGQIWNMVVGRRVRMLGRNLRRSVVLLLLLEGMVE